MSLSAWEQRQSRWNRLHLCVVLLWFLALLLERFVTERGTLLIQNVLIPLSFLTAGGWMFRRREKSLGRLLAFSRFPLLVRRHPYSERLPLPAG